MTLIQYFKEDYIPKLIICANAKVEKGTRCKKPSNVLNGGVKNVKHTYSIDNNG